VLVLVLLLLLQLLVLMLVLLVLVLFEHSHGIQQQPAHLAPCDASSLLGARRTLHTRD
jgi:hypothetical protein